MVCLATLFAYVIGLPLGLLLVTTDKKGVRPMPVLNTVLGIVVNILRSIPFLILAVMLIPFTRAIVGTSIGSTATIVPLVIVRRPLWRAWSNLPPKRSTPASLRRRSPWRFHRPDHL